MKYTKRVGDRASGRLVTTRLSLTDLDKIQKLANKESRTLSNMLRVLIQRALEVTQ